MNSDRRATSQALLLLLACVFACHGARSAVVVHSKTRVDGSGLVAMAGMTATTTETIDGDRAHTSTQMTFDSGVVQVLARSATREQVEIVRLDQDRIVRIDAAKKRYTEHSLADARAQIAQARSQPAGAGVPIAFDDSNCDWSPASSSTSRDGGERVAGIDTERWLVRATQTCTDRQTQQRCDLVLESRLWMGDASDGAEEQRRFHERYAQALGVTGIGPRSTSERTQALFGRYEGLWREAAGGIAALRGQVLKSQTSLGVGGAECAAATAPVDAAATAAAGSRSTGDIGREAAAVVTSTAVTEKTGRWRIGDLSGQLVGSLLAKRKQVPSETGTAAAAPSSATAGIRSLLSVSYEIVSIDSSDVPPETFEVPAGYKAASSR
jgi:hypothetical protein